MSFAPHPNPAPLWPVSLVLALLLTLVAGCSGLRTPTLDGGDPDSDAGAVIDAGGDAGGMDASGSDAGPSTGCEKTDAGPADASHDGLACGDGGVCSQGACVERCLPGNSRCDGARLERCGPIESYLPSESCPSQALCLVDRCVEQSSCSTQTPPCCVVASSCGALDEFYVCPECRPTLRGSSCETGRCSALPLQEVDFTLLATAATLPDATRIASGVVTVYRNLHADGRHLDCQQLLQDLGQGSLHDQKDPGLNPTLSRPYEFTNGTGNDLFTVLLLGLPSGPGQTLVLSVFDTSRGRGQRLGRGCVDGVDPQDQSTVSLELLP